jgi:alanyl-tRNA synthetase
MTSREIRQSFLDFFREKQHSIVPSAPLLPSSPNLLFTNAGMNQFVPYFLGTESAPYDPPRAADTQKCIRAGGKHNDLEDVGYDTYHHTFFEMLGNWSFGNYFKAEAIEWAWELLTGRWGMPKERLYATVYKPGEGDPADFDQEAYDLWKALFEREGLDPDVHIVNGNKADNFWMMGDTGPCGPCSEIHIDLTPDGDTRGSLVNQDDSRCIEIWNLVFIQFNAETDGTFRHLPATHVDTGMGFERACAVIQGTKGCTDFSKLASNYDTDVFTPIFDKLTELSGKKYTGTVPEVGRRDGLSEQEKIDVAFRVIADHIRTGSFAIADGILPSNNGRNYVIRRILRRAIRVGRTIGLGGDALLLPQLAPVVIEHFGEAFPELKERRDVILENLETEERSFGRTLDRGISMFEEAADKLGDGDAFPAATVVKLWETFGFPLDLTQVMIDERGLSVDEAELERLTKEHKDTGDGGDGPDTISAVNIETDVSSEFVGYESDSVETVVEDWIESDDHIIAVVSKSPLYVEKGGQLGDTGSVLFEDGHEIDIIETLSVGDALCLRLSETPVHRPDKLIVSLDTDRRRKIESHHTATHILHWALHEEVSREASQQGSLVAPDRLRFDFNGKALTPEQISAIETAVNERISRNDSVSWQEVVHADIRDRDDIMQFFGDKYGERVRVVQIGGEDGALDGWSMELCGGTHVRNTGDIGLFKIRSEGAIAAGIRRVEAVCGEAAIEYVHETIEQLRAEIQAAFDKLVDANEALEKASADAVAVPAAFVEELEGDADIAGINELLDELTVHRDELQKAAVDADKRLKKASAGAAAEIASQWLDQTLAEVADDSPKRLVGLLPGDNPALIQEALTGLKRRQFDGVAVLALVAGDTVHIAAAVDKAHTDSFQAGKLVQELTALVDGKGGGKPEMARGAGKAVDKVDAMLERARELVA